MMEPEPKEITFSKLCLLEIELTNICLNAPYRHRQMDFSVKGTTPPKMKMCWKSIQLQVIKDVDEFVFIRTDSAKVHFTSLLTNGSSAVNWCHQNELIKT